MSMISRSALRFRLSASLLALTMAGASLAAGSLVSGPAMAESIFTKSADGFVGSVRAAATERGAPVVAGSKIAVTGEGMLPGQEVTLMRGTTVLNENGVIIVDQEGKFRFETKVDDQALTGLHPIIVITEKPASASVAELKISPVLPVTGTGLYEITSAKIASGLYQIAYSAKNDVLFVTSAVGRPPVRESTLSKVSPETLEVLAAITPAEAPMPPARPAAGAGAGAPAEDDGRPPVYAVYGVGLDEKNDTVWVTNTRQNTVAVYKQSDLSLVKQFEPGAVPHAFSIQVHEEAGRAYVSEATYPQVAVFDTETLEQLPPIELRSAKRGEEFKAQGIWLDDASSQLFTVSMSTSELAVTDLKTGESRILPLPGAVAAANVAYDPQEDLLFVTSQQSDNLLIMKASDGTVLHDVETGAGALYVSFEPESRRIFVGNRGAGTLTVVNTSGEVAANLEIGSYPNQLIADGNGTVWAVNKARGADDESGDQVWKIAPAPETPAEAPAETPAEAGTDPAAEPAPGGADAPAAE